MIKTYKDGKDYLPMPTIFMAVSPSNFRDEELLEPKEIFENHGFTVKIISKNSMEDQATGQMGAQVDIDMDITEANSEDCVALVFVGGQGSLVFHTDRNAWRLANEVYEQGKPVAAICIAATTLANAGLFKNKRVTGWPSEREKIIAGGGNYTGNGVESTLKIVTAKSPKDSRKFAEEILNLLRGKAPPPQDLERHHEGEGRHRRKGRGLY